MTKQQNIILITIIAVIAVVLIAVGGYFIGTYSSSDGELRSGGFVYRTEGSTATIVSYEGEDTSITIPARIAGRRVAFVEEGFLDGTSVTEVLFSEDITMIELADEVFKGNTRITHVSLPDSLTAIPDSAFEDCTALERVKLPVSLKTIGDSAFEGCSNLITTGADGESDFVLPDSVTEVGDEAFMDCGDLTNVTIGSSLKLISTRMFDGCDSITTVTFAEGSVLEQINEGAFRDNNLRSLTLPDTLKYIGVSAFENNDNTSFTRVTIPSSVVTVSNYAFSGCSRLQSVTFGAEGEEIALTALGKGVFMNCSALSSITLPDTITEIPELAFYGCEKLGTFTIGEQIESIGDGAFSGGVASNLSSSASINFTVEAKGYKLLQLTSYTYFGSNADSAGTNKAHYLLTNSDGSVVYAYIGAFDPETCNNAPDMSEHSSSVNVSFNFLLAAAEESDISELRPYALAGVKGSVCIPNTVTAIGAFCFMDCEPVGDGNYLNIYIGNSSCTIDDEAFDDTGIASGDGVQVFLNDTNSSANDQIQELIDGGNRNWLDVIKMNSFPS